MTKPKFDVVWQRIVSHQGERFETKQGLEFLFRIDGNMLYPSRTTYQISKQDVEKAFNKVPIKGPGEISHLVRGPSYLWAVLHDKRISQGEW